MARGRLFPVIALLAGAGVLAARQKRGKVSSNGTKLSANISVADFTVTTSSEDNTLPSNLLSNAKETAAFLERFWDAAGGFTINSGYRSSAVNVDIGGSSSSRHVSALAADVVPKGVTSAQFAQMVLDADPTDLDQCLYYQGRGHVHIGLTDGVARRQYKVTDDGGASFTTVTSFV